MKFVELKSGEIVAVSGSLDDKEFIQEIEKNEDLKTKAITVKYYFN